MTILRSALFQVYLVLTTLTVALLGLPAPLFGQKPARGVIKLWARAVLFGLTAICGIRYRIEGKENLPRSGAIVAANHQSMWETIVFFTLLPNPVMVFKAELLRIPVYGWWGQRAGCIPIDRKAGVKSIRLMSRRAREEVADNAQVIVFPEGTRTPVGAHSPLQPGVAAIYLAAEAAVTPAAHDSGRFWRHPGWLKRPGTITLRILPAIPPGLDRKTFLETLRERIESARPDLEPAAVVA